MKIRHSVLVAGAAGLLGLAACGGAANPNADLQGTWTPVSATLGGMAFPDSVRSAIKLAVSNDSFTVTIGPAVDKGTLTFMPNTSPKSIDITGTDGPNKGQTIHGIYERSGDTLKICYGLGGTPRPTAFKSDSGTQQFYVLYVKAKS